MATQVDTYAVREVYTYGGTETLEGTYTNLEQSLDQSVTPGAIATAEAVYQPAVARSVVPNAIASGEAVAQPTVLQQVLPGAIATAVSVPGPTVALNVLPGTIATAASVPGPMVAPTVLPGAIATAAAVPGPQVVQVGPQTVGPFAIPTVTEVVYGPMVVPSVIPAPILTAADVPPPNVQRSVTPDFIRSGTERVHEPLFVDLVPRWCPPLLEEAPKPVAPVLAAVHAARAPALVRGGRVGAPPLREVELCRN